jgi:hypothetical protein
MNVVWFVTSTIVRGRPDYDLYLLSPPRLSTPASRPKPRKPAAAPSAKSSTPTSSDDGLAA